MKIQAQAFGLKFDGQFIRCYVSAYFRRRKSPDRGFTIYSEDYGQRLPRVFGFRNDTDSMTDYFEKDRIRVGRDNPLYREWLPVLRKKVNMDRARHRKQKLRRANPNSKRNLALARITFAGYHGQDWLAIAVDNRIAIPKAMNAYRAGAAKKAAGLPCNCANCKAVA